MKKKTGFSLAEALITLLIVSLVTLAAVPVITKKKRITSTNGRWMCTRNDAGQYVYYDQNSPHGDKDDPNTWKTTGKNSCVFTPAPGTKQFAITVVGGGGGGGNGKNVAKSLQKASAGNTTSFQPEKDGLYTVDVVGGGGGGGDCDKHNDHSPGGPAGAGGGSGAAYNGLLWLKKDTKYTLTAGTGGAIGVAEYHGGCNRSSNNRTPGKAGTDSSFKYESGGSDKKTHIIAGAGTGGDSTSYNADNHAAGGSTVGYAGRIKKSDIIENKGVGAPLGGYAGEAGHRKNWTGYSASKQQPQGGKSVATSGTHGKGGNGAFCPYRESGYRVLKNATAGTGGYVEVSTVEKYYGTGGKAAIPTTYFMQQIDGQVHVTIGERAKGGESGRNTLVQIKKGSVNGREFRAAGAAGGTSSMTIDAPENGESSQFSMKGGGKAADACELPKIIAAHYEKEMQTVNICTQVSCQIDLEPPMGTYHEEMNNRILEFNSTGWMPGNSNYGLNAPAGFRENYTLLFQPYTTLAAAPIHLNYFKLPENDSRRFEFQPMNLMPICVDGTNNRTSCQLMSWNMKIDGKLGGYFRQALNVLTFMKNLYNYNEDGSGDEEMIAAYFPMRNHRDFGEGSECNDTGGEFCRFYNSKEIYEKYRCFTDVRNGTLSYKKVCSEEGTSTESVNVLHDTSSVPAKCPVNKDKGTTGGYWGTLFGAGGGGGNAGETVNVVSSGGYGAYGGVIIEWQ